jgi:hypothetical protein
MYAETSKGNEYDGGLEESFEKDFLPADCDSYLSSFKIVLREIGSFQILRL